MYLLRSKGILNSFYRKGPGIKVLDIAAEKAGTKIYDITSVSPTKAGEQVV